MADLATVLTILDDLVAIPTMPGGMVLSGHLDVVSTEGQDWASDPFRPRRETGRVYGRGVTDMKGIVACAIAVMEEPSRQALSRPLYLALSADEEST
ncbi:M20/M25/M40 family metallo-hydrolase [Roseovarius sp. CAU 1744]|uniref:M20/M25/M40 family metallo-hydrolase n=1 Tax=Roseovarius sp. CAU 1744 TaxID=3140368 RepID=UPI00325BFC6A